LLAAGERLAPRRRLDPDAEEYSKKEGDDREPRERERARLLAAGERLAAEEGGYDQAGREDGARSRAEAVVFVRLRSERADGLIVRKTK